MFPLTLSQCRGIAAPFADQVDHAIRLAESNLNAAFAELIERLCQEHGQTVAVAVRAVAESKL